MDNKVSNKDAASDSADRFRQLTETVWCVDGNICCVFKQFHLFYHHCSFVFLSLHWPDILKTNKLLFLCVS